MKKMNKDSKHMTVEKVGSIAASGGSIVTGIATVFNYVPIFLGCVASIAGIILSSVMIYCHLKKRRDDHNKWLYEKRLLEIQIQEHEIKKNEEYSK